MSKNLKPCPFCGEEIDNEAIQCEYCGEKLNTNSVVRIPITVLVLSFLIVLIIAAGAAIAIYNSLNRMNITQEVANKRFVVALSTLDQAIILGRLLSNNDCNTPDTIKEAIINQININEEKSSDTNIFLVDGETQFLIEKLNPYCESAPKGASRSEASACAKIIIDVNAELKPNKLGKDRFQVLEYKDMVVPIYNSREEKLLERK